MKSSSDCDHVRVPLAGAVVTLKSTDTVDVEIGNARNDLVRREGVQYVPAPRAAQSLGKLVVLEHRHNRVADTGVIIGIDQNPFAAVSDEFTTACPMTVDGRTTAGHRLYRGESERLCIRRKDS